jgi:hypothetical protein
MTEAEKTVSPTGTPSSVNQELTGSEFRLRT